MSRLPAIGADGRRGRIAAVAGLALAQAGAAALSAFATRDAFAALHAGGAIPPAPLALIALAGLLIAAARVAGRSVAETLGQHYAAVLRLTLFDYLARCPAPALARRRAGGLALRFVGDLTAVRGWVGAGLPRLLSAALALPAAVATAFALDPALGAAISLPLGLGLAAMALAGRRLGPAHDRLRSRRARLAVDMSERVMQAPQLRLIGRMQAETARLARRSARLIAAARSRAAHAALLRAIPDACAGVAAAALLLASLRAGLPAATAAGGLAALGLALQPMREFATVWDRHRAWRAARRQCLALLQRPLPRRPRREAGIEPGRRAAAVRLERVALGDGGRFDASAAPGERIALVGANGAGKSALLDAIAGLQPPTRGRIRVDRLAPATLTLAERRRTIGLVGPRAPLLAGSLRRALTLGLRPRPADEAILGAANAHGLQPLLARLGGLDGAVAEGGRNLSAGELRRLLLARAALAAPRLLLIDASDDALGPEGAGLLDRAGRAQGATVLVATHDLALARRMDTIWFVADGRVVETGPAAELLAGDGAAARFLRRPEAA